MFLYPTNRIAVNHVHVDLMADKLPNVADPILDHGWSGEEQTNLGSSMLHE